MKAAYTQARIACAAFTGAGASVKAAGGLPIFATVLLVHSFAAAFLLPIRPQRERWLDVWIMERARPVHATAADTAWGTVRPPRLSQKAEAAPPQPH